MMSTLFQILCLQLLTLNPLIYPLLYAQTECPSALIKIEGKEALPRYALKENRGKAEFGGFAYGIDAREISEIAESFSTPSLAIVPLLNKDPSTLLFNASNRGNFNQKLAVLLRDIAGTHFFNDANHRISYEIALRLYNRNGVINRPTDEVLRNLISKIGRNAPGFQTAEEIETALRGY